MIVTAAFLLGTAYESCHNGDYDPDMGALVFLAVFMWFDYEMALVIA